MTVNGAVSGTGSALISGSATLEFGAASSANTTFDAGAAGTLKLDHSVDFAGIVSGFERTISSTFATSPLAPVRL